ncbi:MAG: NAD(P)-dependent oxidoreductase [Betaproteobacteria bacterium]|nr:NAD(P)-dependent oxidoreductase [Betaproteobacteria bacterium]
MSCTLTKIAFAGLGQMGRHMARNLLGSDVELTVCNTSSRWFEDFRADGAKTTNKAADLAQSEIIFLCLPGDLAVRGIVFGEDGLLPHLGKGHVVVDCSTVSYALTQEVAVALEKQGAHFLDAPISGMETRAREGTLSIMVGGDVATLARVEPFLRRMGNKILHMGAVGNGQLTKLVNQLLFNINIAALAEILPLAVKMGLDPVKTGEIVNSGTGRSYASEFFIPRILEGRFSGAYPMCNAYKDFVNGSQLAFAEQVPLPVMQAAAATYQTALLKGCGAEDKGAMIKVFEELLGVTYRRRE